jgi:hypothetical protein
MGLEIYFPDKPNEKIRGDLKAHGWRYVGRSRAWYHRRDDYSRMFAEDLAKGYTE